MARVSPPNKLFSRRCSRYHKILCHGNFQESFGKRTSHNRSSLPKRDATRERLDISFPEGILLTTHDHALLTNNFRALAPVKNKKSFLKSARSAHTTELATCNAHATLRRPARPPGFSDSCNLAHVSSIDTAFAGGATCPASSF